METLNYTDLENEVLDLMEHNRTMVFATGSSQRVTARMMSVIHVGLTVYFQTSRDSIKYAQLKENPHVALCAANIQVEGLATVGSHPMADESTFFADLYQKYHRGSFITYSRLPGNVVVGVEPTLITLWKYDDAGQPFRDYLNVEARTAFREMYPLE